MQKPGRGRLLTVRRVIDMAVVETTNARLSERDGHGIPDGVVPAVPEPVVVTDPVAAAKAAGLRYVTDTGPGLRRKRAGRHWSYVGLDGAPIKDPAELKRIKSLGIPPAYTDVWISPNPRGHIQATGRDAKGRKQYRYHDRWREVRDETKYGRMIAFGQALPAIRAHVAQDLARRGMPREKVLATIVRLLETTLIRVGNEEYARTNQSFGLTTMRDEHVDVERDTVHFSFRGKSGIEHTIDIRDRRLAKIVKRSQDLPGEELFQYIDEDGQQQTLDSGDVNDYLREITGQEFTAKDFRTWAGTVLAAQALQEFEEVDSEARAKTNIVQAIERVAERLGNTRDVCRKCYVHPAVIDAYLDGSLVHTLRQRADAVLADALADLEPEEAAVLAFLRTRLATEEAAAAKR
jgi:DNA topoisomerase-1